MRNEKKMWQREMFTGHLGYVSGGVLAEELFWCDDLWRTTETNVEKVTSSDEIYERIASARRRVKTMTPAPLPSQDSPDSPRTGGILMVTIVVRRTSGFRPFSTRRRPAVGKIIVCPTTHAANERR